MKSFVKAFLSSFLIVALWTSLPEARDYSEYRGDRIVFRYEPALDKAARRLAQEYPEIRADVENKIGWRARFIPTVVLFGRSDDFDKIVANRLITGFAVPGRHLIVIDYSKTGNTPFDLRDTLAHELGHLLLHDRISNNRLPRWLDEGIAQWASGGKADILNPGGREILKRAAISGNLIDLADLTSSFPRQDRQLLLAYEESRSLIEYIAGEHGEDSVRSVLGGMAGGKTVEEAIRDNLNAGLSAIEQEWKIQLKNEYSLPAYIADHIYWVLFASAAFITIAAYLKFRQRLRNYRDEEPEESARGDNPS